MRDANVFSFSPLPFCLFSSLSSQLRVLLGLAMYDSDDGEDDNGPRARMFSLNEPRNWLRISSAPNADAHGMKGYDTAAVEGEENECFYYNVATQQSQWERPVFSLGPPVPHDLLACQVRQLLPVR